MGAAPAFARQDLDRLIALGLRKGELTPADLQAALPIHAMSAEDIARVVLELEEAGVPVELEDLIGGLAHPGGVAPLPIAPEPGLPGAAGRRLTGGPTRHEAPPRPSRHHRRRKAPLPEAAVA